MPRKGKSSVGYKRKGVMQGASKYSKSLNHVSNKYQRRKRKKYNRLGTSIPALVFETIHEHGCSLPEAKRVCYRMTIYYHYVEVLNVPHSIHWKGKGGTIFLFPQSHSYVAISAQSNTTNVERNNEACS